MVAEILKRVGEHLRERTRVSLHMLTYVLTPALTTEYRSQHAQGRAVVQTIFV